MFAYWSRIEMVGGKTSGNPLLVSFPHGTDGDRDELKRAPPPLLVVRCVAPGAVGTRCPIYKKQLDMAI